LILLAPSSVYVLQSEDKIKTENGQETGHSIRRWNGLR
jgi:hypothetical protein